ncbi:MAG: outer membrane protein assembly factor BamD [Pseudomonadota bacterium]
MKNYRYRIVQCILVGLCSQTLPGCGFFQEHVATDTTRPPEQMYAAGRNLIRGGDMTEAIKELKALEARYPFEIYTQQGQLELAYAYYMDNQPDEALGVLDRFIRQNPVHKNMPYAYYLRGTINFYKGKTFLNMVLPREVSDKDPTPLRIAFNDYSYLIKTYPGSIYTKDARKRMVFLRNAMAEYELHVAGFYLRRNAYVAAANRCKYAIENYKGAPAVADALLLMEDAYIKMDMVDLAKDTRRVFEENFPGHEEEKLKEDTPGYFKKKSTALAELADNLASVILEIRPVPMGDWKAGMKQIEVESFEEAIILDKNTQKIIVSKKNPDAGPPRERKKKKKSFFSALYDWTKPSPKYPEIKPSSTNINTSLKEIRLLEPEEDLLSKTPENDANDSMNIDIRDLTGEASGDDETMTAENTEDLSTNIEDLTTENTDSEIDAITQDAIDSLLN